VTDTWTVARVLTWATDDFRAKGMDSPRLEAELLLAHSLGCDRIRLVIDSQRPLEPLELAKVRALIQRRRRFEPMAYILGQREFWGRAFTVDANVLIPRPDTEVLVEVALELTKQRDLYGVALDLCTGSGCVAVTFALERPTWRTWATDISPGAVAVARANAARLGALGLCFAEGDLFQPIDSDLRFDLITANPPYIPEGDLPTLQADIREHEPHVALTSGADGLDLVRKIVPQALSHLAPAGALALEIGADQAERVANLMRESGYTGVSIRRDLGNRDRVVFGRAPEG
jgi:release factor glutamine methyltransferase